MDSFTLVDFTSKEEYFCINIKHFFQLLNMVYNKNQASCLSNVIRGRASSTAISNRIFILKGGNANKDKPIVNLFDIITGQNILISQLNCLEKCKELGFMRSSLYCLKDKKQNHIAGRYILDEKKDENVFILVDYLTKKEYKCITNSTIFIHLNIPYIRNEASYVDMLKTKRQHIATIGGHILYLKGNENNIKWLAASKNDHLDFIQSIRVENKRRYKISSRIRTKIYQHLKRKNITKDERSGKYIGCTYVFYMDYIASQFNGRWTWDDYGHKSNNFSIDHIICVSAFKSDTESLKKAFNYINCRPLNSGENYSKLNRVTSDVLSFLSLHPEYYDYLTDEYKGKIEEFKKSQSIIPEDSYLGINSPPIPLLPQ